MENMKMIIIMCLYPEDFILKLILQFIKFLISKFAYKIKNGALF